MIGNVTKRCIFVIASGNNATATKTKQHENLKNITPRFYN